MDEIHNFACPIVKRQGSSKCPLRWWTWTSK